MEPKRFTLSPEHVKELRHWVAHPGTLNPGYPADEDGKTPADRHKDVWDKIGAELGFDPSTRHAIDVRTNSFMATPTK